MSEQRITISLSSLLWLLATVLLLVVLWQIRSLVVTFMVAVVLAASIAPLVDGAERLRIPRWLATIAVYVTLIAGLTGMGLLIGPTVIEQINRLIGQLPFYVDTVRSLLEGLVVRLSETQAALIRDFLDSQALNNWVIRSSQQLLVRSYSLTRGIVGGVFSLILSLFISGYMVVDSKTLINSLLRLFPRPWDERLAAQVVPVSYRMGGYIRGRVLVSGLLGVVTAVGLSLLGLEEFALGLGAIAGLTNLIPFLGPILGAFPALLVALSQGGWPFLWVLLFFIVIQNLETYVLDPLLVGSSVGVHPLYQLLAVLGGAQVLGIVGALIVPPWIAGGTALLENLYLRPKLIAEKRAERAAIAAKASPATQPPTPSSSLSSHPS